MMGFHWFERKGYSTMKTIILNKSIQGKMLCLKPYLTNSPPVNLDTCELRQLRWSELSWLSTDLALIYAGRVELHNSK